MKIQSGDCPACKRGKTLKPVSRFLGRDWPGSLCLGCGHFTPDVRSASYDLSCPDCKKPIGTLSQNYHYSEPDETLLAAQLEAQAQEQARAAGALAEIGHLELLKSAEKDPMIRRALENEIEQKKKKVGTVVGDVQIPRSWQKRHAEKLGRFYCDHCHRKRRDGGVDFFSSETYVRQAVKCALCKQQTVAWLDLTERASLEEQTHQLSRHVMYCVPCTPRATELEENEKILGNLATGRGSSSP